MKNFKKALSLFLSFIFILTASVILTSCGDENTGSITESNSQGASTSDVSSSESQETTASQEESSSGGHGHDSNVDFIIEVNAVPSETEAGIINAVITLSHTHYELLAIQFHLSFSSATVDGVYTTLEELDQIMTSVPTYKSTLGVDLPSFEQISLYNKASSIYECMFVDLLSYPMASPDQTIDGIKTAEDFVITIPFKVSENAKVGDKVTFELLSGTVGGTQAEAFSSIKGSGNSVTYTLTEKDLAK